MDVDQTLAMLRKHSVASATFGPDGALLSVQFAYVSPPKNDGEADSDDTNAGPSLFRSQMHTAAGVLQGRLPSMREEHGDA